MPQATAFLSLPDELIIEIISNCSLESVLRIESSCKSLYQLCQTRAVWQARLHALDVEHAPNIDPFQSLDTISTSGMRKMVLDAVRMSRNWQDPGQRHKLLVTEVPLISNSDDTDRIVEPRLLPGGKQLLLLHGGKLELWSLVTKERLWQLRSPVGRMSCVGFDCELIDGGKTLIVAILFEDFEISATSPLCIYSYDLTNNTPKLLFERVLPPVFLFRMMVRGDYFIACIPRTFQTVVINWKTGEALMLDFVDLTGKKLEPCATLLACTDLVAFVKFTDIGFSAIKLPISSLKDRWSTATDHTAWPHVVICPCCEKGCNILQLPYLGQQDSTDFRNDSFGPWILAHRVFTPTWKPSAPTEIFLAAYDCGPGSHTPTRLVSFRLQLSSPSPNATPGSDTSQLALVKSSCFQATQLPWNSRSLSNAGRMFSLRAKIRCFSLFTDVVQPMNELVLASEIVPCAEDIEPVISSVEPWSGAIAIGMPGVVKVLNFM